MYILVMVIVVCLMIIQQIFFRKIFFNRKVCPARIGRYDFMSPVDGTVVYDRRLDRGHIYSDKLGEKHYAGKIHKKSWHIGIFMTPFDRHYVTCPVDAEIINIERFSAGLNLPMLDLLEHFRVMFMRKFDNWLERHLSGWLTVNERCIITFRCLNTNEKFKIILIGDKYVNKIDVFFKKNDIIDAGNSIAFIKRGSQCDLVIPRSMVYFAKGLTGKSVLSANTKIMEIVNDK